MKNRNIINKIHFYILIFVLLNFIIKQIFDISLNYGIASFLIIALYLSGIILFIWHLKPFRKVVFYFSIYILTPILTFTFWLIGGIFFGIMASFVLYPIYPEDVVLKNDKITVYEKYQGFLGACCTYKVTEKKLILLEKRIDEIVISDGINFENSTLISEKGITKLTFKYEDYDFQSGETITSDSIIFIGRD